MGINKHQVYHLSNYSVRIKKSNITLSEQQTKMQHYKRDEGLRGFSLQQQIIEQKVPGTDTVLKRYAKGRLLGKGGFAKCYQFTSLETNRKYAAKVIQKASLNKLKAKDKLASEIKIHKSLKHQNIVGFQHCFEDADNVYILLEMCPNQTLNELLKRRKRLTQIQVQYYMYQIADAVKYLHSEKVIHRDLKLGNLFLSDKLEIKIGDFGLASKLTNDGQLRKTMCGTPNYIAPQILQNKKGYSYSVDAWSFGVIAYALLTGRPPFQTNDVKVTYSKIKTCNYSFPQQLQISEKARFFVSRLLLLDPCKRLTIQEALNDNFFMLNTIPASLPISTLACPPNANFMRQFQREEKCKTSIGIPKQIRFNTQSLACRGSTPQLPSMQKVEAVKFGSKMASIQRNELTCNSAQKPLNNFSNVPRTMSTAGLLGLRNLNTNSNPENKNTSNLWITYFQENPKFGLAYLLNSNAMGMKFNDSTTLISNSFITKMTYIQFKSNFETRQSETFTVTDAPQHLMKKMKIVSHYHKELKQKKVLEQSTMSNEIRILKQKLKYREPQEEAMKNYITRYCRDPRATIFWFNNNDIQAVFQDQSRLIISKKVGVYLSKHFERKQFLMTEFQNQSQEVRKRIIHVSNILDNIKAKRRERKSVPKAQEGQKQNTGVISKCSSNQNLNDKAKSFKKSQDFMKICVSMNKLLAMKRIPTDTQQA